MHHSLMDSLAGVFSINCTNHLDKLAQYNAKFEVVRAKIPEARIKILDLKYLLNVNSIKLIQNDVR
jgi:hypothetical protein